MAIINQMWEDPEWGLIDPFIRERIELGVAAGAKLAAVMERGQREVNMTVGKEAAVKSAVLHYHRAFKAEKQNIEEAELGELNKHLGVKRS